MSHRFRVVTYNVHKCRGLDRRIVPERIARVLRETEADVVALQEVVNVPGANPERDQARYLASQLSYHFVIGPTRLLHGGPYGNALLSRFPIRSTGNYNLSVPGREPRGCMRADLWIEGRPLHLFNVHLGTSVFERQRQAHKLLAPEVLHPLPREGPRLVVGDFNEWMRGLVTRMLCSEMKSADIRVHLRRSRTYPGLLPLLHLDHIYYDPALELERVTLHRSRTALVASDHLPISADFRIS
jgi:endonuclease/exonuclease/phosphatase family metal-dependent hydrolase